MNIAQAFSDEGPLPASVPGYRSRPGQSAMAQLVEVAVSHRSNALIEAPTGTGKSVAYLAPAILARKKALVVTANIALQEQLVNKDLPMLRSALGVDFRWALLKGINNYVCLRELASNADKVEGMPPWLQEWLVETTDGDKSKCPELPAPEDWALVSTDTDGCAGDECPFAMDCHGLNARAAAKDADIIVTNYHLLCAYIAIGAQGFEIQIAPGIEVLILDEAHRFAGIARDFFGIEITPFRTARAVTLLEKTGRPTRKLKAQAKSFWKGVDKLKKAKHLDDISIPGADEFAEMLKLAALDLQRSGVEAWKSVMKLSAEIRDVGSAENRDDNFAYWVDEVGKTKTTAICSKPVDVSKTLRGGVWDAYPTVVATSATLTVAGGFGFIRRELGVDPGAIELEVPSPFDYESQALLVTPTMPDGNAPHFLEIALRMIREVVAFANGRTLLLFTSYATMNAAREALRGCGHRVLCQGEGSSRTQLVEEFRRDTHSVLLGVESFWAGVDVPGEALSCVVMDKIPFHSPDDPVMRKRGTSAFFSHFVPEAVIQFKQGFGRLIRTESDRGVCVLLDGRLRSKGYGSLFLDSLPAMKTSVHVEDIGPFLAGTLEDPEHVLGLGAVEVEDEGEAVW